MRTGLRRRVALLLPTPWARATMRRVVKVGGSLLGREDLTIALPRWLERQAECETLMLTGGGGLVDAIRDLDAIRPGDPVRTHWICVELLDVTFRLMSNWFDWPTVNTSAQLQQGLIEGFAHRSAHLGCR